MRTTHLATFVAVAREGSVTAAAGAVGVAQSTVTRQVRALESELGARLLVRNGGRAGRADASRTAASRGCARRPRRRGRRRGRRRARRGRLRALGGTGQRGEGFFAGRLRRLRASASASSSLGVTPRALASANSRSTEGL